jgi:hypothetical protein
MLHHMKTTIAFIALVAVFAAGNTFGVSQFEHESDHTMLVNIVSDPPGATVYAVPLTTNDEPVALGRTPYTALVEFDWGKGWFTKKWNRLAVYSPAEICRAEYTSEDKLYDVYMMYMVEAPGYETLHRDDLIASFTKPKELDWERITFLPGKKTIDVALQPSAVSGEATRAEPAQAGAATVMMATASDESAAMGTVHVVANTEDAAVMVDGRSAGRTPVKLVLGAGEHSLEVHKAGYLSYSNNISVKARSQVAFKVTLVPGQAAAAPETAGQP